MRYHEIAVYLPLMVMGASLVRLTPAPAAEAISLELCAGLAPQDNHTAGRYVGPALNCSTVQLEQRPGCAAAAEALVLQCVPARVANDTVTQDANAAIHTLPEGMCHRWVELVVRRRQCTDFIGDPATQKHEHTAAADEAWTSSSSSRNYQWAGAIGSVTVISVAGLGVLSLIPVLSKIAYKNVLQFLVALAIGTLVGDAALHLLPHALVPDQYATPLRAEHEGHGHSHGEDERGMSIVWRASMALVGIYIFYNAERLLGVLTHRKAEHDKAEQLRHQPAVCKDESDSRPAECGSCGEISVVVGHSSREIKDMVNTAHQNYHARNGIVCHAVDDGIAKNDCEHSQLSEQQNMSFGAEPLLNAPAASEKHAIMPPAYSRPATIDEEQTKKPQGLWRVSKHHQHEVVRKTYKKQLLSSDCNGAAGNDAPGESEASHRHSHNFVQSSLSSVAYMVVAGDGMHNFTDGLAIGVAFSGSLAGGISTALAVLCHELPHELGDFAMLLKAGMTIKQAFLCNIISAALCLMGSVIGVAVGSVSRDGEHWLFGLCGGIFLYIALVDMMPEISRVDKKRPLTQLFIQDLGLVTGFSIMLVIALFEGNIETAITSHLENL